MESIAERAGLGASTVYRHFPSRDDLMEAVLSELISAVRENAARADDMDDAAEAFRFVFAQSCVMPESHVRAFADIAASSPRLGAHAQHLIEETVRPVTERALEINRLRDGLSVADVAALVRLVDATDTPQRRRLATDLLLEGMLR
ncbi:TetR/AcrR family transcriptional regulator; helix-turn-helix transcriptional regulator [Streptomyces sp. J2-1]|uniref:TetR/AcrR family transcriptional regulator n=1 Tax=Streptomyces corallincola TaxID=2851888 RepID=UPI001C38372F|nr:TetR/AcrR family transcriptional regulator [Streptomyces corallincola]MBV2353808.1 TetR/AcrR family transcriptional regulator; helix-turn-helix transcriptional regulator [Streptomyces corallincola]